ncbi:hypothetical protein D3C83_142940 [compost metagenome]
MSCTKNAATPVRSAVCQSGMVIVNWFGTPWLNRYDRRLSLRTRSVLLTRNDPW